MGIIEIIVIILIVISALYL
jgi:NADH-quinone oxidoreductase subunit A